MDDDCRHLGAIPKKKYARGKTSVRNIEPFLAIARSPGAKIKRPAQEELGEENERVKRANIEPLMRTPVEEP